MFQKTNYFIALFFVLFALQSCQKEVVTPVSPITIEATETTDNTADFSVTVEDGFLNFPTTADYENAIEYLADKDIEELAAWNESIGFSSLQQYYKTNEIGEKKREVDEELFASLLNEDKMIKINGNTIMVDLNEEAVYVLTNGETASIEDLYNRNIDNESIKVFPTDVDVLDILDGDESSLFQKSSYCDSNSTGWQDAGSCGDGQYEWRMRYFKAGIYYSLTAKYRRSAFFGAGCGIMDVRVSDGFARNKKKTYSLSGSDSGTINAEVKPYSRTRRLKDYSMTASFDLTNTNSNGFIYGATYTIDCD